MFLINARLKKKEIKATSIVVIAFERSFITCFYFLCTHTM